MQRRVLLVHSSGAQLLLCTRAKNNSVFYFATYPSAVRVEVLQGAEGDQTHAIRSAGRRPDHLKAAGVTITGHRGVEPHSQLTHVAG